MIERGKTTHSKFNFESFLNFLKDISSELLTGLVSPKVDYELIDSISLKLIQTEGKIESLLSWLDTLFVEDKNKYERSCLVLINNLNEIIESLGYHKGNSTPKAVQCLAITKKGVRCKKMTTDPSHRCAAHQ